MRRCQRISVSGVTANTDQRARKGAAERREHAIAILVAHPSPDGAARSAHGAGRGSQAPCDRPSGRAGPVARRSDEAPSTGTTARVTSDGQPKPRHATLSRPSQAPQLAASGPGTDLCALRGRQRRQPGLHVGACGVPVQQGAHGEAMSEVVHARPAQGPARAPGPRSPLAAIASGVGGIANGLDDALDVRVQTASRAPD